MAQIVYAHDLHGEKKVETCVYYSIEQLTLFWMFTLFARHSRRTINKRWWSDRYVVLWVVTCGWPRRRMRQSQFLAKGLHCRRPKCLHYMLSCLDYKMIKLTANLSLSKSGLAPLSASRPQSAPLPHSSTLLLGTFLCAVPAQAQCAAADFVRILFVGSQKIQQNSIH